MTVPRVYPRRRTLRITSSSAWAGRPLNSGSRPSSSLAASPEPVPADRATIPLSSGGLTPLRNGSYDRNHRGDIAQLGERCVRIAEVGGSNPPISILPPDCLPFPRGEGAGG